MTGISNFRNYMEANSKKIKYDIDFRKSQMKDNKEKAFALFVKNMEK
jgi:hypothetical protein